MGLIAEALHEFDDASPALVARIVDRLESEVVACGADIADRRSMRRHEQRLRRAALDAAGYSWWPLIFNVLGMFVPTPVRIALWIVNRLLRQPQ